MALSKIVGEFEVGHETVECALSGVGVLGGGVERESGGLVVLIVEGSVVVGVADSSFDEHGRAAGHNQEVTAYTVVGPFVGGDFGVIYLVVKTETEEVELGTALAGEGDFAINIQIIIGEAISYIRVERF